MRARYGVWAALIWMAGTLQGLTGADLMDTIEV